MGKRVQQADGSYCYTENCKIHDRSFQNSGGITAVKADQVEGVRKSLQGIILKELRSSGIAADHQAIAAMSEDLINKEGFTDQDIYTGLGKALTEDQHGNLHIDKVYNISSAIIMKHGVKSVGDEVILPHGERGRITEGGGLSTLVRVETDDPQSSHDMQFFPSSEVMKLDAEYNPNRPERMNILSQNKFAVFSGENVSKMFNQESFAETNNAQALRDVPKEEQPEVREAFLRLGQEAEKRFPIGTSRNGILKYLHEEGKREHPEYSERTQEHIKTGLQRMYRYLSCSPQQ